MAEFIKLLSSISVLIAAFAGFNAINKWKAEKFDKEKISFMEMFYDSLIDCKKAFSDFRKGNFDEDCEIENITETLDVVEPNYHDEESVLPYGPLGYFLKGKREKISRLNECNHKTEELLDDYMKFSGGYPSFYFNIFDSLKKELISCINNARFEYKEGFIVHGIDNEFKLKMYFEKAEDSQIFDILMLQDEYRYIEVDKYIVVNKFEEFFKRLVVLIGMEIRFEHSSLFAKPVRLVKIMYLKHRLRSSVIYNVGSVFLYMDVDGFVVRKEEDGAGLSDFEKKISKGLVLKEIKYSAEKLFLE